MILKDDKNLEDFKSEMINKLKQLGFNPKISTVSGGESINFESIQHTENKTQAFKIPVKLNRKVMVQGTPDCQAFFIKHFKDQTSALTDVRIKDESGKREVPEKLESSLKVGEASSQYKQESLTKLGLVNSSNKTPSSSSVTDSKVQVTTNTASEPLNSVPISTQGTPFSTPRHITSKFLERSGALLTPSRVAQIAQIKDTVESLESSFVNLKQVR